MADGWSASDGLRRGGPAIRDLMMPRCSGSASSTKAVHDGDFGAKGAARGPGQATAFCSPLGRWRDSGRDHGHRQPGRHCDRRGGAIQNRVSPTRPRPAFLVYTHAATWKAAPAARCARSRTWRHTSLRPREGRRVNIEARSHSASRAGPNPWPITYSTGPMMPRNL